MERFYISNVELSGYKSVEGLSVSLNPGLNIIIGKNAVGKTNFMTFLNKCMNFDSTDLGGFQSKVILKSIERDFEYVLQLSKSTSIVKLSENEDLFDLKKHTEFEAKFDVLDMGEIVAVFSLSNERISNQQLTKKLKEAGYNLDVNRIFIKHGLPKKYSLVKDILNIDVWDNGISNEAIDFITKKGESKFVSNLVSYVVMLDIILRGSKVNDEISDKELSAKLGGNIKNDIIKRFDYLNGLRRLLEEYTPIQDIRFNESFSINVEPEESKINIRNFYLEFKVDDRWFMFNELSDGTKRVFYIISELFSADEEAVRSRFNKGEKHHVNLVFIEEPELGIHPKQLHNLMRFIKEKSRRNQIVITTHSPKVLDTLEQDELDSILIATKEKGKTILKKLSKEKKNKAKLYMQDIAYLSDFWLYSDLED